MSNFEITVEKNKEEAQLTPLLEMQTEDVTSGCDTGGDVVQRDAVMDQNKEALISATGKYSEEQEYWEDFALIGNDSNSKPKHCTSQRMKLHEHTIIANRKACSRLPSDYKFDRATTSILQMLIEQRYTGEFHNVVGRGTSSIVIHTHCPERYRIWFTGGNAVKVYKLGHSIEKNNAIYKRVQREYEHLLILRQKHFSNNVPHLVFKNKNVIVMSFIGSDYETAPSISSLPLETLEVMYYKIIKEMDTWYKKLGLVHGNLSASNILYWVDQLYFIGWSHSVKTEHPMALKKLMKDCHFITTFFRNKDFSVKSAEDLFKSITGLEKISTKVLAVVDKDLWKGPLQANPNSRTGVNCSVPAHNRFKGSRPVPQQKN